MPQTRRTAPTDDAPAPSEGGLPAIAYAVLTSLVHEPHSGYELSQLFGPPRNFMWEAKHSQVYPTLALLAREGHVVHSAVEQSNRPTKKVYRITPQGRAALRDWALSGPSHVPVRDEFSLRLSSLCLLDTEEAVTMLKQQIELVTGEIEAIETHLADFGQRFGLSEPVAADHHEYGLWSAIRLSCELKKTTVAWYRGIVRDLQRATTPKKGGTPKRPTTKRPSTRAPAAKAAGRRTVKPA